MIGKIGMVITVPFTMQLFHWSRNNSSTLRVKTIDIVQNRIYPMITLAVEGRLIGKSAFPSG